MPKKENKPRKVTLSKSTKGARTTTVKQTRQSEKSKPIKKTQKTTSKPLSLREKKIQEIRKKLLAQKKSLLLGAIEALNELPGQTVFPDLGDQATAEMDRNFMLRLRGRERKLLKKIDEAIERIKHNTFGICDRCGSEIDIRRLEARPVTTMCIDCKTLQEEEERLSES